MKKSSFANRTPIFLSRSAIWHPASQLSVNMDAISADNVKNLHGSRPLSTKVLITITNRRSR
ncbi:MAG: hypothetical protein C0619_14185 [Desulfuromonas sp.]|nr:MAG: hypothetical protein C0619_14185 [Desulfuromonas sp.]